MRMWTLAIATAAALLGATSHARAQAPPPNPIPTGTARRYFANAHLLCSADNGKLWGVSLCGPIMFVDPQSRSIVASEGDTKGALTARDGVFVGALPSE